MGKLSNDRFLIAVSLFVGMMMTVFYDIFLVLTPTWFTRLEEPHQTISNTILSGLFATIIGLPLLAYFFWRVRKNNKNTPIN